MPPKKRTADQDQSQQPELCSECQTGVMNIHYLTYFTWLNEELISVPNFPAWVCDVCGRREYDPRAIQWLNALLSPETGRKHSTRRGGALPRTDRLQP
jgi:YgiT-type zinc finger domain-containing protein